MKNAVNFKLALGLVSLCFSLVFCFMTVSMAQPGNITVTASGGAGYLPLEDWKDFASSGSLSYCKRDRFGSYLDFRLAFHISEKHGLAVNLEKINVSALRYDVMLYRSETGDITGNAPYYIKWDFEAIPIGLSYEYYPRSTKESICPFFGVGGSFLISKVKARDTFLYNSPLPDPTQRSTRDGNGYGFHVYVGLQSKLTDHLLLISRLRGRYADGMAFTDNERDVKVEFTGVDLTLGIGWRF